MIHLTPLEMELAAYIGLRRQTLALENGRADQHGFSGDGLSVHVQGAAAELAFAKSRDRYWLPLVDNPKTLPGDVGHVQIRSTARPNGCLIVHQSDPDDAPFVLMVGQIPTFRMVGWIYGREAKHPQFWREDTGRPAFFVPQDALRSVEAEAVAA